MRKIFFILAFISCSFQVLYAQKKDKSFTIADEENAVFKNEWSLGMRMHTNGFSAFYERVWIKSIWKKQVLQTNFFYFKYFKQKKVKSPYAEVYNANGYFYGKQNSFWNVNVLYGQKKILAEKADKNGVRVSMIYMGGVSLGILKPYALSIVEQDNFSEAPPETVVRFYEENNSEVFLNPFNNETRIFGPAGMRYGFNKIKPVPGIHGKFGFNFDWAGKENVVKSIELGAQVDIYYRKLPVMISSRNKPYVLNLYLAFQLGKRW
jgi:hypothetical protein